MGNAVSMGAGWKRGQRSDKWKDFVGAVSMMEMGDPPLRWKVESIKESRCMSAALSRRDATADMGLWFHCHEGELWVIRFR